MDGIFVRVPERFVDVEFFFDVDICVDDIAGTSLGAARFSGFSVTFPGHVFHVESVSVKVVLTLTRIGFQVVRVLEYFVVWRVFKKKKED